MNKKITADILVAGFALFAMFFGAGNLIFPPYLGYDSSSNWLLGVMCFVAIDIGLSLLGIIAVAKTGRGAQGITEHLGKFFSVLLLCVNTICLGPLIAIPRTAATTFEFGIAPIFPGVSSWIFSIIFFAIVVVLSLKQTRAVDIIGSILAPIMLVALLVLIIKGVVSPLGSPDIVTQTQTVVKSGILAGYQTMDMMGAIIMALAIISNVSDKGYTEPKQQFKIIVLAGLVSAAALFVVYGGLAYLGATASTVIPAGVGQSSLLIAITKGLLGQNGILLLGIIVAFACLTTAVGLLTSSATFFATITHGKLPYTVTVFVFAIFSCVVSNFGISTIIAFAAPILELIYPVLVVLIVLSLFDKITNTNVHKLAALAAFITSFLSLLELWTGLNLGISYLPLEQYGFPWLLPAVIFGIVGGFIKDRKKI
ncbi:MAG: branched-chain amino acid transport system II carrier protein [Oscillospiraceae bacterium]